MADILPIMTQANSPYATPTIKRRNSKKRPGVYVRMTNRVNGKQKHLTINDMTPAELECLIVEAIDNLARLNSNKPSAA